MKALKIFILFALIIGSSYSTVYSQLPPPPPEDHENSNNFPLGGGAPIGGGAGILLLMSSMYGLYRYRQIDLKK